MGLRYFHIRDLRHHGATNALSPGFTGEVVMTLGDWTSGKVNTQT